MSITLNNGFKIAEIGMGTYQCSEDEMQTMVNTAITAGYTDFDTAYFYGNEKYLAHAIKKNGVDRDKIKITTKIWCDDLGYELSLKAFEKSEENLGKIDVLLIHWPCGDRFFGAWRAFEEIYKAGKVSAIGVSNFLPHHINELCEKAETMPMISQIEAHVSYHNDEIIALCRSLDIAVEAYSPLRRANINSNQESVLAKIALGHGVSWAQVALRYLIQLGLKPIPKSSNPERIKQNIDVFDFELSEEDMSLISDMNSPAGQTGFDPDTFIGIN